MIGLFVERNGVLIKKEFNTVTEAYYYYLKHYSTFREWWYYLFYCHKLLNRVTDEAVMERVFFNVLDGVIAFPFERKER